MEKSIPSRIERMIGPLPGQREARAFSWIALACGLIACGVSLYYGFRGEMFMGRPLGSDFVQFYAAGRLLNAHQPERIFDVSAFSELQHEILPSMSPTQMLVYGYPPLVGQLFRPFALLPYRFAYCAWLVFSMALYAASLWLLFRHPACDGYRRTAFLLALSAPMYTLETWMGGQLSVIGVAAVVLFVCCFEMRWPIAAGLALGLASYKPSLLAIPAAMMIVSGSWRMLAGLGSSLALVILTSVWISGMAALQQWIDRMRVFSFIATSNEPILRRTKYVDLNSFFTTLLGASAWERALASVVTTAAFLVLAWAWWRGRNRPHDVQRFLWAATLIASLLINIYAPVYDTILLVPAAALLARSLAFRCRQDRAALQAWLIVLALAPWVTQSWADYLRFQLLTVVLAGFGCWALSLARARPVAAGSLAHAGARLDAA